MALERVDKGLITNTSLEYENEVKPYLNADKELKRILQSNNMELEDLFHALAIDCEILCIVNFTQVNDCCKYVRKKYLSYYYNLASHTHISYIRVTFSFMKSRPSRALERASQ